MIVTLTLNAAVDKAYHIYGAVEPGTVMRVHTCRNTAGGKGLNVARVIKLCGENVMPSGLAGGNTGALLEALAYRDGLNSRFVHVNAQTRCCINILDGKNRSTEFLEPGEEVTGQEIQRFMAEFEKICTDAEVVTMSGSVPKGVGKDIYRVLVEKVKGWGKKVILDTSGELLKEGIQAAPHMIKPNQEELGMLLKRPVTTLEEAKEAAMELHAKGIGYVVVSLGKDGALLVCDQGILHGIPPRIKAVNTVGCGDSMVAAFAVAFRRGYTAKESLKYAVAVSAANALSEQTGHFEPEELERIYPCVRVRDLAVSESYKRF
ncbi:1-phosphofructokinase [Enterocloster citroniae]|uniref:1-phosphofructokinase n=1 Tax=Enterocloster citroniae TaxID=358743 RepID=UPI001D077FEA|nr:1-phosphofructokinase [Enterocloster citroniae]MCB7067103.1 1-phosphofructokinase [Enterocloster citroniae]